MFTAQRMGRAGWLLPLVLVLAAACSGTQGDTATDRPAKAGVEPGVVHVHGLGINPKDGALYAATHTGLFRIPENGKAERIANRYQDTMGFTIVGPDHFLGSGHPDVAEYRAGRWPPLLGLIESTDGGRTWRSVSLLGKADFHALHAAHDRVYGFDSTSGSFMVSTDGKTWETRSQLAMFDFAVSPADPDLIVAALPNATQRSRDGGRTWEPLSAPALTFLAWQEEAALWGVTAGGALFRSADAGASWQQVGTVNGRPNALLAHGARLYVSVHEGSIFVSEDGGATWRLRYRDPV